MATVNRRQAREWALQLLFQMDANPGQDLVPIIQAFWVQQLAVRKDAEAEFQDHSSGIPDEPEATIMEPDVAAQQMAPKRIRDFTEKLVYGVTEKLDEIDERLGLYIDNWPLYRMGGVDRNVLRMAIFEMFFDEQTPPIVAINEAVDLAKYFSSNESGRFVNGILDRACKDVTRPPREPGRSETPRRKRPPRRNRPAQG